MYGAKSLIGKEFSANQTLITNYSFNIEAELSAIRYANRRTAIQSRAAAMRPPRIEKFVPSVPIREISGEQFVLWISQKKFITNVEQRTAKNLIVLNLLLEGVIVEKN